MRGVAVGCVGLVMSEAAVGCEGTVEEARLGGLTIPGVVIG